MLGPPAPKTLAFATYIYIYMYVYVYIYIYIYIWFERGTPFLAVVFFTMKA